MERKTITLAELDGTNPLRVSPVFVLEGNTDTTVIWPCSRCWDENGKMAHFSHVHGGICFKCNGFGGQEMDRAAAEKRAARLLKTRLKAAEKREAERQAFLAQRAEWQRDAIAERPLLAALLTDEALEIEAFETYDEYEEAVARGYVPAQPLGRFVAKMAQSFRSCMWRGKFSPMTERQLDAAVRAIEAERAKLAEKAAVVAPEPGKATFEGTVVKAAWYDNNFGGGALKLTVKTDAGWLAFGTLPGRMYKDVPAEELKGLRIHVEATLEASERDRTFLFFKRPTKGTRWL
jgi:hypothetical protein